jgi:Glyoxalase/Bleomycin resistance protein/Dioxygenase superfamily
MNIRIADIKSSYDEWRRRGAEFLTEPKEHKFETRCYMREPDGYIIEVGQSKDGWKRIKVKQQNLEFTSSIKILIIILWYYKTFKKYFL